MASEAVGMRRVYTCTFPGCPCPVEVALDVIQTLEDLGASGVDCQGLLLGACSRGATDVRGAAPVASFDAEAIGNAIPSDGSAIGYYRIRASNSLTLTDQELAVAERYFPRRGCVVLLIERAAGQCEGNFFFRDGREYLNVALLSFPVNVATISRQIAERARREEELAAVEVARSVEDAALEVAPEPVVQAPRGRRLGAFGVAVLFVTAAALGIGIGYWRHDQIGLLNQKPAPLVLAPGGAVPLRAERQGQDLKVSWDLGAPALATAAAGELEIEDSAGKRKFSLNSQQVRFGSLLFTPNSDQVTIDLTVTNLDGTKTQGSLLAILTKSVDGDAVLTLRKPSAERAARPQPTRSFVPPSTGSSASSPAEPADDLPQAQVRPQQSPTVALPTAVPPPPPQQTTPSAPAGGPPFAPPVLTYQPGVQIPAELRVFQAKPVVVTIRALVDETGRVVSVDRSPQKKIHAAYVNAAADAAMRCRFRPARRGDTPVRSDVNITIRFSAE